MWSSKTWSAAVASAGLGSVLYLYGEPGAELVTGIHLKQPMESLGTFGIRHDHARGISTRTDAPKRQTRAAKQMEERQRAIGEYLESRRLKGEGKPTTEELEARFKVSEVTLRKDLKVVRQQLVDP